MYYYLNFIAQGNPTKIVLAHYWQTNNTEQNVWKLKKVMQHFLFFLKSIVDISVELRREIKFKKYYFVEKVNETILIRWKSKNSVKIAVCLKRKEEKRVILLNVVSLAIWFEIRFLAVLTSQKKQLNLF